MIAGEGVVYVVDDDDAVRKGLRYLFASVGLRVEDFPAVEPFRASYSTEVPGCLLLDVRMPGTSGLELLEDLVVRDVPLPVIMLSGHGDIPTAVWAVQRGALDFIQKPGHEETLLRRVQDALRQNAECLRCRRQRAAVDMRFAPLSDRENEVMRRVASGYLNKQIAEMLGISERTVETHRKNALQKLNTNTGSELYSLVLARWAPVCPATGNKVCPGCRALR